MPLDQIIYFAHHVNTYNKPIEQEILTLIKETFHFAIIINPNNSEHQENYKKYGMSYFENLVTKCTTLIALPFPDGSIGAGIGKEIAHALTNGFAVYYIEPQTFKLQQLTTLDNYHVLSVAETRERLRNAKSSNEKNKN